MQKKIIFIVGFPGTKKSFIRHFFDTQINFETYKWSNLFLNALNLDKKNLTLDNVEKLITKELENPFYLCEAVIAKKLIKNIKEFILIDGVKNISQVDYLSQSLKRRYLIVRTAHNEKKRLKSVSARGQFDDLEDNRRMSQLKKLGLGELLKQAKLAIDTTNVSVNIEENNKKAKILFTHKFCSDLLQLVDALIPNNKKSINHDSVLVNYKKEFSAKGFDVKTGYTD